MAAAGASACESRVPRAGADASDAMSARVEASTAHELPAISSGEGGGGGALKAGATRGVGGAEVGCGGSGNVGCGSEILEAALETAAGRLELEAVLALKAAAGASAGTLDVVVGTLDVVVSAIGAPAGCAAAAAAAAADGVDGADGCVGGAGAMSGAGSGGGGGGVAGAGGARA